MKSWTWRHTSGTAALRGIILGRRLTGTWWLPVLLKISEAPVQYESLFQGKKIGNDKAGHWTSPGFLMGIQVCDPLLQIHTRYAYICVCVLVHTCAYTHTCGHHILLCSYLKIYLFLAPYSEGNHYIMSIYLIKKLIVYDVPIEVELVIYNF